MLLLTFIQNRNPKKTFKRFRFISVMLPNVSNNRGMLPYSLLPYSQSFTFAVLLLSVLSVAHKKRENLPNKLRFYLVNFIISNIGLNFKY